MPRIRTFVAALALLLLATPGAVAADEGVVNLDVRGAGTMHFEVLDARSGSEPIRLTCGGVPNAVPPRANLANPTDRQQRLCTARFTVDECPPGQGPSCVLYAEVDGRKPNYPQFLRSEAEAIPAHWRNGGWVPADLALPEERMVSGCTTGGTEACRFRVGQCEASGCTYDPAVTLVFAFRDIRVPTAAFRCRLANGTFDPSTACGPPPDVNKHPAGTAVFHARSDEYHAAEFSTLLCRLDGGKEAPCPVAPGPVVPGTFAYTGLSDGPHTIAVRAVDPSGNEQSTATTASFSQRYPPITKITSGPNDGAGVATRKPTFTFAADRLATFECRFDQQPWTACEQSFTPDASLTDGAHTFSVRATRSTDDGAIAEVDPPVRRFTVDLVGPEAMITRGPAANRETTERDAAFEFVADPDEPGTTFRCRLDDGAEVPCDEGSITYLSLPAGTHTFTLTAFDPAGNGLKAPIVHTWTVIADVDRDGQYAPVTDCDDGNPAIWRGAPEIPGNGIDENCDGVDPPDLDVDGDGALAHPQGRDCDDNDPGRHPGAPEVPGNGIDEDCDKIDPIDSDKDDDGVLAPPLGGDCDDEDPDIRPGVRDKPGNGIDENCNELDAQLRPVGLRFPAQWQLFGSYTRVVEFYAADVSKGTVMSWRCRGGCKQRAGRIVARRKRARIGLVSRIGRRIEVGAVLKIKVAKAGRLTEVHRWAFRSGDAPDKRVWCTRKGRKTPCSGGG